MIAPALTALFLVAGQGGARATWSVGAAEVEVGEPFELVLELEAPADVDAYSLADVRLQPEESLVLFSEETSAPEPVGDGSRLQTRHVFRLASLRPGVLDLEPLLPPLPEDIEVSGADGARIEVRGLLGEDEGEPRGPKGFPADFLELSSAPGSSSARPWVWIALAATGLALFGLFAWRRRRGRRRAGPVAPDPRAELARLGAATERGADPREVVREVTGVLRGVPGLAPDRPGVTDEEWIRDLRSAGRIPDETAGDLAALLAEAREVKYAGRTPSPWAVRETIERAERVLTAAGAAGEEAR